MKEEDYKIRIEKLKKSIKNWEHDSIEEENAYDNVLNWMEELGL